MKRADLYRLQSDEGYRRRTGFSASPNRPLGNAWVFYNVQTFPLT